jgi:hypothetical protein
MLIVILHNLRGNPRIFITICTLLKSVNVPKEKEYDLPTSIYRERMWSPKVIDPRASLGALHPLPETAKKVVSSPSTTVGA